MSDNGVIAVFHLLDKFMALRGEYPIFVEAVSNGMIIEIQNTFFIKSSIVRKIMFSRLVD